MERKIRLGLREEAYFFKKKKDAYENKGKIGYPTKTHSVLVWLISSRAATATAAGLEARYYLRSGDFAFEIPSRSSSVRSRVHLSISVYMHPQSEVPNLQRALQANPLA